MARERDLTFSEGETWVINFALRDAAGQPLNLSGALVEWAVASTLPGGASLLVASNGSFVTITDAEGGLGVVSIPPDDHIDAPAGEYRHELRATLADLTVTVQITGYLTVGDSIFIGSSDSFGIIRTGGLQLIFDSGTTDADPGDGEFRFNHATPASAGYVYVDRLDRFDVVITDWLAALDDSTTAAARGHIRFTKAGNEGIWHEFLITGAVETATGYRKIPVDHVAGGGSFSAGDIATVHFSRTGDQGEQGDPGPASSSGALTPFDRGSVDSGTETPEPGDGAMQIAENDGAHTLAAPTNTGAYVMTYTNGSSAGAITASGWDRVDDADTVLSHVVEDSIIECAAYNDGVRKRLIVTLIEDAT